MPNSAAVFQKLFKTIELCEPMFQSVVVLYRNKVRIRASSSPPLQSLQPWMECATTHGVAQCNSGESWLGHLVRQRLVRPV